MIAGTITLEDHQINFWRGKTEFHLAAFDCGGNGQEGLTTCSDIEMGALLALLLGGDEVSGADKLYPIAEEVVARLGIRLIP